MTEGDSPTAGTPRWVKVFGIIALVLVVLLVVMIIAGRGDHGPGRHTGDIIPFTDAGGPEVATVAHTEP
jgi:ABC-type transporter Mla subunit MlaD